ncbi:MAG TPA: amidohydrolase family protein [Chthoniobacteraceae bacterium]|jgi:predicted TIM-barrel fold metal-dependent hydrolase|nr:amidohydrolase family protein [Chthoniobacteraceae bacterium]
MSSSPLFTRRAFLGTTALATAGCATLDKASAGYVDAHVHVWTPDTRRYPIPPTTHRKDMVIPSFTPEQLFAHSRPAGVRRTVLVQMSFYEFDNRYMLDCMHAHPGVFSGIGIVDETQPTLRETMRALGKEGVRGFRVYADREKVARWEHSDDMKKMWGHAADHGQAICLLADPEVLPAIHRMCQAYPKTRVVIDHFARIGMKGPIRQSDLERLRRLADFPHTHVKISAFYALGAKRPPYTDLGPMVHSLRDTYGAQRLMWASDSPYQVQPPHTYAASIALIRDRLAFLTADDKEWMLRRTAEKVFFT